MGESEGFVRKRSSPSIRRLRARPHSPFGPNHDEQIGLCRGAHRAVSTIFFFAVVLVEPEDVRTQPRAAVLTLQLVAHRFGKLDVE